MEALIDRKNKIIMDWSAKAGCTLAVRMFFKHMGILETALAYSSWVHDYREAFFYNHFGLVFLDDYLNPEYFKFKVVRNPYDRAVSSYFYYLESTYPNESSFAEFIHFLETQNLKYCNLHWRAQTKEIPLDKPLDKIVKIENFKEGMQQINDLLKTNFEPEQSSWHHLTKKDKSGVFVGETKFKKQADLLNYVVPNYEDFYNKELRKEIETLYAIDFTYGYPLHQ
jgi:hypothetical protein